MVVHLYITVFKHVFQQTPDTLSLTYHKSSFTVGNLTTSDTPPVLGVYD